MLIAARIPKCRLLKLLKELHQKQCLYLVAIVFHKALLYKQNWNTTLFDFKTKSFS